MGRMARMPSHWPYNKPGAGFNPPATTPKWVHPQTRGQRPSGATRAHEGCLHYVASIPQPSCALDCSSRCLGASVVKNALGPDGLVGAEPKAL